MKDIISFFEQLWSSRQVDLDQCQIFWDGRAEEFRNNRSQARVKEVMNYLELKKALNKNTEILDIGCGAGKYSLEFAKRGQKVIGLDISPKMIEFAQNNALENNLLNVDFKVLPWEKADVISLGWEKKFDLVVAIMTPAISGKECLDRMLKASRGYCLMSSHINKKEKIIDEIEKNILKCEPVNYNYALNIYCSLNILWQYGIYPEINYYDMCKESSKTLEDAFHYYCHSLKRKYDLSQNEEKLILNYLSEIEEDGIIKDVFQSRSAWLFWKNK